ncbi:MAG: hypothetical protein D6812_03960 [Deltaproteobacteria bacterium]|nr:MAG: hypothetical protein D6812_03960 [Deltaproteobacteria bacterium]
MIGMDPTGQGIVEAEGMFAILLSSLISVGLLLTAAFFALSELRARWHPQADRAFHTPRRFRRRIVGTLLLTLIAVMFFWGVNRPASAPLGFLLYWGGWIALLFSLTLLAFYDMEETKEYFTDQRKKMLSDLVSDLSSSHPEDSGKEGKERASP